MAQVIAGASTMTNRHARRFYHGLRFKLLLISLTLFAIPWAGYHYISGTEGFLRQAHEQSLSSMAQSMATTLGEHADLFTGIRKPDEVGLSGPDLYVHELPHPIQLDGYAEEWETLQQNAIQYPNNKTEDPAFSVKALAGRQQGDLYLLLEVTDPQIIYCQPNADPLDECDQILLGIEDPYGRYAAYRITTSAPGWVSATAFLESDSSASPDAAIEGIQGEWQETERGYTVELRISKQLAGSSLSFTVGNADNPEKPVIRAYSGSADPSDRGKLGTLVTESEDIRQLVEAYRRPDNIRIWVLDRNGLVLSRSGTLQPETNDTSRSGSDILRSLYQLVLNDPPRSYNEDRSELTRLNTLEVIATLHGDPITHRRSLQDTESVVVSTTQPISTANGILGMVIVEQTSNAILSLQHNALQRLFALTFGIFFLMSLLLLGYATVLTRRIRNLRTQIEQAVTEDGRIQDEIQGTASADELGDLHESFANVLIRLREYNRYLEAMASRLAHEFRTPLSIIKSSLENMQATQGQDKQHIYLQRAQEGTKQLLHILNRMREATRLEQTLQNTEIETVDMLAFVTAAVENYRSIYPKVTFEFNGQEHLPTVKISPELISQAMDKLVGNATDFHTQGTPIILKLTQPNSKQLCLQVINQGPLLPEGMSKELFQSMISVRNHTSPEPHLGLGLYLVRLICEFHGGRATASNMDQEKGVIFTLELPIQ